MICELGAVQKSFPKFKQAFANLENRIIQQCDADWAPKTFGFLTPESGKEYGRTTILPELFDDNQAAQMCVNRTQANGAASWNQTFENKSGNQTLITGTRAGDTIPEDFKIGWMGLAFPNKTQHITEIKYQISDRKYGRLDLEEMLYGYECPAIIFEEGYVIDEETYFEMWGYVEPGYNNLQPENGPGGRDAVLYQTIVMLGAAYYKQIDRVLGNTGAVI